MTDEIITAKKAREISVVSQLNIINRLIKRAVENGKSEVIIELSSIYPENIEKLTPMGYDVTKLKGKSDNTSQIKISWYNEYIGINGKYNEINLNWE